MTKAVWDPSRDFMWISVDAQRIVTVILSDFFLLSLLNSWRDIWRSFSWWYWQNLRSIPGKMLVWTYVKHFSKQIIICFDVISLLSYISLLGFNKISIRSSIFLRTSYESRLTHSFVGNKIGLSILNFAVLLSYGLN